MPRKFKLSWQPGSKGRKGRWRKKYKKRSYYFPGGVGRSDRDAYLAALEEWEKLKMRLDAEVPKPHQVGYDLIIAEWELVLVWSRKHGEETMADSRGLEDLYLGHAPRKLSGRHYAKPPQELFDEAITWLREEYRIEDCGIV
ncbi:MAG: hypothetical protein U9N87_02765 [Planctomycetota bacterium]|nr:hypothetical protein [Planctomycetota bacterium]